MKLGFLTPYSDERVKFAKEAGFGCLELNAAPGSPLDAIKAGDNLNRIKDTLDEHGISVSALACYINHFEMGKEEAHAAYFAQLLQMAPRLDCQVVATMSGCTPVSQKSGKIEDSLEAFTQTFSQHAKVAEDAGVKIAFENWPGGHPAPLLMNIAFSPYAWDKMFDAVASPALGLEYDPSHLERLQIEPIEPIARFASRIHHVHAKDTTIKLDVLENVGYIGQGWWNYSIPGRGVVDWPAFFEALEEIDYQGGVCIEHEDPEFQKDKFDDGLYLGQKFLSQFL